MAPKRPAGTEHALTAPSKSRKMNNGTESSPIGLEFCPFVVGICPFHPKHHEELWAVPFRPQVEESINTTKPAPEPSFLWAFRSTRSEEPTLCVDPQLLQHHEGLQHDDLLHHIENMQRGHHVGQYNNLQQNINLYQAENVQQRKKLLQYRALSHDEELHHGKNLQSSDDVHHGVDIHHGIELHHGIDLQNGIDLQDGEDFPHGNQIQQGQLPQTVIPRFEGDKNMRPDHHTHQHNNLHHIEHSQDYLLPDRSPSHGNDLYNIANPQSSDDSHHGKDHHRKDYLHGINSQGAQLAQPIIPPFESVNGKATQSLESSTTITSTTGGVAAYGYQKDNIANTVAGDNLNASTSTTEKTPLTHDNEQPVGHPIAIAPAADLPFTCHVCSKKFKLASSQARHIKSFHVTGGNTAFGCPLCEKRFPRNDELLAHRRKEHQVELPHAQRRPRRNATVLSPTALVEQPNHQGDPPAP